MPGLGRRLPYVPDPRDEDYPTRRLLSLISPSRRERPWTRNGVVDQGETGTCGGWTVRQLIQFAPFMLPPHVGPNGWQIYQGIVPLDEWPDNDHEQHATDIRELRSGTSVRAAMEWGRREGWFGNYYWAKTAQEIADFVTRRDGGMVAMGTLWFRNMGRPDPRTGVVEITGPIDGGHMYVCRWYDEPRGLFEFLQSWGLPFGKGGRFYMEGEKVDKLLGWEGEGACPTQLAIPERYRARSARAA